MVWNSMQQDGKEHIQVHRNEIWMVIIIVCKEAL